MPAVLDLSPAEDLGRQHPRANRSDPAQRRQGVDIPARRGPDPTPASGARPRALHVACSPARALASHPLRQALWQRGAVPSSRRVQPLQKIMIDSQAQPLRDQQALESTEQPRSILLHGFPGPMQLSRIFLHAARYAHDPPHPLVAEGDSARAGSATPPSPDDPFWRAAPADSPRCLTNPPHNS